MPANPSAAANIPLTTGLGAADFAAGPDFAVPFFAGDSVTRSLNRARLGSGPGIPPDLLNRTAGELLSAVAVTELVRLAAGTLGLAGDAPDLLLAFNRTFENSTTRPAALSIAQTIGRRLSALLLTLHRGAPADRAARPDWNDDHWAFWAGVERVVIGGGLFSGSLGEAAVVATHDLLTAATCPLVVERSPCGGSIALVGLARHAPSDAARMLLFDFGQTAVKRGLARYRDGALTEVRNLPSLPAPDRGETGETREATRQRWAAMRDRILADWRALVPTEQRPRTAIGLALATHLRDGHPFVTDHGPYSRLGILAPHLAMFVRDELAEALGPFRGLALLHDGLAAASTRAGEPRTVVLTLGTAIGAGYVPVGVGLRPMLVPVTNL